MVYVLDEPSAGLHPVDTEALLQALDGLKRAGNSLFVVEHDLDVIRRADWIVDVGPGAGQPGGQVLFSGRPEHLREVTESVTRRHLFAAPQALKANPRSPAGWTNLEVASPRWFLPGGSSKVPETGWRPAGDTLHFAGGPIFGTGSDGKI